MIHELVQPNEGVLQHAFARGMLRERRRVSPKASLAQCRVVAEKCLHDVAVHILRRRKARARDEADT